MEKAEKKKPSWDMRFDSKEPAEVFLREYVFILLASFLAFFLLSAASFHPADDTLFSLSNPTHTSEISNLFGPLGASVADWLFQLMGPAFFVLGFVCLALLIHRFRTPRPQSRLWLRVLGFPQFFVCFCALLTGLMGTVTFKGATFPAGGLLGLTLFDVFRQHLGTSGAHLAFGFGLMGSLPLCLGVRPLGLIGKVFGTQPSGTEGSAPPEKTAPSSAQEPLGADTLPEPMAVSLEGEGPDASDWSEVGDDAPVVPLSSSALAIGAEPAHAASPTAPSEARLAEPWYAQTQLASAPRNTLHEASALPIPLGQTRASPKTASVPSPSAPQTSRASLAASRVDRAALEVQKSLLKLLSLPNARELELRKAQELAGLKDQSQRIEHCLMHFKMKGHVTRSIQGPVVNIHDFHLDDGQKVSKLMSFQEDLTLALQAQNVLMFSNPAMSSVSIQVPAATRETVSLRELLEAMDPMARNPSALPMALGKMVDGTPLYADLASLPHLLMAGATGSGKSVGINAILLSLLMTKTPRELRLILIDPKMLELAQYEGIGHLLMPVITETKKAAGALAWAVQEMENRYRMMMECKVRHITAFNEVVESRAWPHEAQLPPDMAPLPHIVVVIDEFCDLMMTAKEDVEASVLRIAQKARAAGIHLIVATQRPSVEVITGLIKANFPSRISFQVTSKYDSRTILDEIGAEKLLGKGDMLFTSPGHEKRRAQCAYVTDKEVADLTDAIRKLWPAEVDPGLESEVSLCARRLDEGTKKEEDLGEANGDRMDDSALYLKSLKIAESQGHISGSQIQRLFQVGYNKAARIIERMEKEGVIARQGAAGKPRELVRK